MNLYEKLPKIYLLKFWAVFISVGFFCILIVLFLLVIICHPDLKSSEDKVLIPDLQKNNSFILNLFDTSDVISFRYMLFVKQKDINKYLSDMKVPESELKIKLKIFNFRTHVSYVQEAVFLLARHLGRERLHKDYMKNVTVHELDNSDEDDRFCLADMCFWERLGNAEDNDVSWGLIEKGETLLLFARENDFCKVIVEFDKSPPKGAYFLVHTCGIDLFGDVSRRLREASITIRQSNE